MLALLKRLKNEESGQTVVEYGLLLALISVVAVTIMVALGGSVITPFTTAHQGLGT